ncbi:MAG: HAMP domain-containing protein [Fibrobacteres bacterium]|nr:HAMP domain-containing protein [Fibrobacterota bacterium]
MERMHPRESIQAKLLRSFAFQSAAVLALAFSAIMILDWHRASRDLGDMEDGIRAGLSAKGQTLTRNLSLVIRPLAEDNAIASIREIVDSLADQDPDIAYAAYLDGDMRPWAFRSKLAYGKDADMRTILRDSMALWASRARTAQSRTWMAADGEIFEFAAPIAVSSSGNQGVVRVGLDTRAMQSALRNANEHVWQNRKLTFGIFLAAAICAFVLSLTFSRFQAGRLTRPVLDLAALAQRIAGGDYDAEFNVRSEGEFALLAETFESMRRKIQAYTHKLESLVAEKVRQIGDLLENVDQGLFTFNLDLSVNPDHSARACSVLRLDRLEGKSLEEILRMTPEQARAFRDWVDVVQREHALKRWTKLSRLSPVREIILDDGKGAGYIVEIAYRKIMDTDGRIKIMALAEDVTEKRALVRRLDEEKVRHERRVKIILGVAGNGQEAISEFVKDTGRRLDSMVEALLPGEKDWKRRIFFDCHTIKGNAGGFGFEALAKSAQDLESQLANFQREPDSPFLVSVQDSLRCMDEERCKIGEVYRMLYGSLEKPSIRLDPDKVDRLMELAVKAKPSADPAAWRELVASIQTLHYRKLSTLTGKYQDLLAQAAEKLGKEADFLVEPADAEVEPALILRVDEALVHILRNCLAHGIEDPEIRAKRGKGKGCIKLSYSRTAKGGHVFSIQDDGNGIDGESLANGAVALGLITPQEAAALSPKEKIHLIFKSGLSTSPEADSISGRGQGMAIAWERVRAEDGELGVETWAGVGTRFTISLPDRQVQTAPAGILAKGFPIAT